MTDLSSAALPPLSGEDHVRGPDRAPMVIFYGDFTCVRCAVAARDLARSSLRVAYRHLVLGARGPRPAALAAATEAAALQGSFWAMHDDLFADQGHQDDPHLWARCATFGIDLERFDSDRRSAPVSERVIAQTRAALRGGAIATPTLILPGGTVHSGPPGGDLLAALSSSPP